MSHSRQPTDPQQTPETPGVVDPTLPPPPAGAGLGAGMMLLIASIIAVVGVAVAVPLVGLASNEADIEADRLALATRQADAESANRRWAAAVERLEGKGSHTEDEIRPRSRAATGRERFTGRRSPRITPSVPAGRKPTRFDPVRLEATASAVQAQLQGIRSLIVHHDRLNSTPFVPAMGWKTIDLAETPPNGFMPQPTTIAMDPDGRAGWVWGDPMQSGKPTVYATVPDGHPYNDGYGYLDANRDGLPD